MFRSWQLNISLKKGLVNLQQFPRLKNPRSIPFFLKKKLRRQLTLLGENDPKLKVLASVGAFKYQEIVDRRIIDDWIYRYGLSISNLSRANGNLHIPFFNKQVLDILSRSPISSLLDSYFLKIYGSLPVLQCIPSLVISYPNISHDTFDPKTHNFPAIWHTDYLSEFTVHIPITPINLNTTHTMYAKNTHTSLFLPPKKHDNFQHFIRMYGNKTDAIMLDVDGWHSGRLEGTTPRIMIQFKFTRGNDLLLYPVNGLSEKQIKIINITKKNISNYKDISRCLREDFLFLQSSKIKDSKLSILKDNLKYYQHYYE